MAAFNLQSISAGRRERAPRVLVFGVQKIGKSTFAASAPNPIFLPIKGEDGIDALDVARFPMANTADDVISAISNLYSEPHDYQTLVIDSASALELVVHEAVCQANNVTSIEHKPLGFGRGYVEAVERWQPILQGVDALRTDRGMACIIIGHVVVKRFDDPCGESYDQYQPAVNKGISQLLNRWADATWFINTKTVVKEQAVSITQKHTYAVDPRAGQRYLFTQQRPGHPGGGRGQLGKLPYEIAIPENNPWAAVMAQLPRESK